MFHSLIGHSVGDESESVIENMSKNRIKENSTSPVVSEQASYADVGRGKIHNVKRAIGIAH